MAKNRIGWECPKCGACYAPSVSRCWNCPGMFVEAVDEPLPPFIIQDPAATVFTGVGGSAAPDPRPAPTVFNGETVA